MLQRLGALQMSTKTRPLDVKRIMFTDEKAFRLSGDASNSYNSRVWVDSHLKKGEVDPDIIVDETVHFARHVMVSCGVSWN
eukprot:3432720-Amphidinium_carterae.1